MQEEHDKTLEDHNRTKGLDVYTNKGIYIFAIVNCKT